MTTVNIYAPTTGAPQYLRQTLTDMKGETDRNTIQCSSFDITFTILKLAMALDP